MCGYIACTSLAVERREMGVCVSNDILLAIYLSA
jgi:hypothetical protein